jgi:Holliday junction resolvase RusA-like endonuclease
MASWTLPWCSVTTNHAYAGVGNGRLRKTASAASWQAGVAMIVAASGIRFPKGQHLALTVYQYPPKGWHGDTDGFWKLLKDAIAKGLGINDYWIVEEHDYRGACGPDPRIVAVVEPAGWRTIDEVARPASGG